MGSPSATKKWYDSLPPERKEEFRRRSRERVRAWTAANPERAKKNVRRGQLKQYGITPEDFEALAREQGHVCAICRRTNGQKALAVDHCHQTGKIRGLLCDACNVSLGRMGDCPERLRRAAEYLENC